MTRTFGPFTLVRRLGAGGMAETFEAVRTGPGGFEQRVCVKRILPAVGDDPAFVRLFRDEARLAARLRHANIVQVIDFGVADGAHYLALELVEGCDLRELLRVERTRAGLAPGAPGGGLTSGLVAFLAVELATALEIAHGGAEAIVHRDLSPSNVLLSAAGEVKLADFGIARAITDNLATSTRAVRGKVPYMAPEYALRGVVDRRVDLFALGVLLYEALAGVRPFDGRSDVETLSNLERGARTPLGAHCPTAPPALIAAIEGLLAPSPDSRTPNATALLDALVDVVPPPTARRILGEQVKRVQAARRPEEGHGQHVDPLAATSVAATTVPAGAHTGTTAAPAHASATRFLTASATPPPAGPAPSGAATSPLAPDDTTAPDPRTALLTDATRAAAPLPARPYAAAAHDAATRTAWSGVRETGPDADEGGTRTRVDATNHAPVDDPLAPVEASIEGTPAPRPHADVAGAPAHADEAPAAPPASTVPTAPDPQRRRHAARARTRLALGAATLAASILAAVAVASRRPRTPAHADTAPTNATPAQGARPRAAASAPHPPAEPPRPPAPATPAPARDAPPAASSDGLRRPSADAAPMPAAPDAPLRTAVPSRPEAPPTAASRARTRTASAARADRAERAATDASASAPSARALLTIVSERGHTIYVDGQEVGAAPLSVPLAAGHHVLSDGDGAGAATLAVDLARGERRRVVLR